MTQIRKATRQKSKLRLGLSSVSGGGKTMSAIRFAKGFTGDLSKVVIIDTENGSADLYANMGEFSVLTLSAPYPPEKYIKAIADCVAAGFELIIVDSITHEWDGVGGCLEIKQLLGDGYDKWKTVTPRHQRFIEAITQCAVHVITTVRRKQDYEMTKGENGSKGKVNKVGLKEVTREGFEYELTANLEIEINHHATASKDRTGLFPVDNPFLITEETGKQVRDWCESGVDIIQASVPVVAPVIETLTLSHAYYASVKDAIVNKGVTGASYADRFTFSKEAADDIAKAKAEKAKPVPVTQQNISDNLKKAEEAGKNIEQYENAINNGVGTYVPGHTVGAIPGYAVGASNEDPF